MAMTSTSAPMQQQEQQHNHHQPTHPGVIGVDKALPPLPASAAAAVDEEQQRQKKAAFRGPTAASAYRDYRRCSTVGGLNETSLSADDLASLRRFSMVPDRGAEYLIDVDRTWKQILEQEDTDHDCKITVLDSGPKVIVLGTLNSGGHNKMDIRGTYSLSILLQELALARDMGLPRVILKASILQENPVDRLSRMIKEMFWDNLTRSVDENGLLKAVQDPKNHMADHTPRLYVPYADTLGVRFYTQVAQQMPVTMQVIRLPQKITPEFVTSMNTMPGLLSLGLRLQRPDNRIYHTLWTHDPNLRPKEPAIEVDPEAISDEELLETYEGVPFIVPGGRFNEMYGWDSYFESLGLLNDGKVEMARNMVDNFCYEIRYYGKILNANRSYYLTRSQPPFLTDMILQVFHKLDDDNPETNLAWLKTSFEMAIREYWNVWLSSPRYIREFKLSRYCDEAHGMPPETESTHFNSVMKTYAEKAKMDLEDFKIAYQAGEIDEPELDQYFMHDRAVRESGHDTTYRLDGRCAHLLCIDLNALLYRYEMDIGRVIRDYFDDEFQNCDGAFSGSFESSFDWFQRAERRARLMTLYMWNEEDGLYYDFDFHERKMIDYKSATTVFPLWARLATEDQAARIVNSIERLFEEKGGIVCGTAESRGHIHLDRPNRQWDYPFGWAPHQILAWEGLVHYGYPEVARRLAYKWLYMITQSYIDFNGTVPEKFDVVERTHRFHVEYGNVGTEFSFISKEGFGWMNTSYQLGLQLLTSQQRTALRSMVPPELLFGPPVHFPEPTRPTPPPAPAAATAQPQMK